MYGRVNRDPDNPNATPDGLPVATTAAARGETSPSRRRTSLACAPFGPASEGETSRYCVTKGQQAGTPNRTHTVSNLEPLHGVTAWRFSRASEGHGPVVISVRRLVGCAAEAPVSQAENFFSCQRKPYGDLRKQHGDCTHPRPEAKALCFLMTCSFLTSLQPPRDCWV